MFFIILQFAWNPRKLGSYEDTISSSAEYEEMILIQQMEEITGELWSERGEITAEETKACNRALSPLSDLTQACT